VGRETLTQSIMVKFKLGILAIFTVTVLLYLV